MIINYKQKIEADSQEVVKALHDFEKWHLWWPKKFRLAYINQEGQDMVYFSPVFGVTIVWLLSVNEDGVSTKYTRGPVVGNGDFFIEKGSETTLNYNIKIEPKNGFFKLILRPKLFEKTHIKHMKMLFNSLESYLNQKINE